MSSHVPTQLLPNGSVNAGASAQLGLSAARVREKDGDSSDQQRSITPESSNTGPSSPSPSPSLKFSFSSEPLPTSTTTTTTATTATTTTSTTTLFPPDPSTPPPESTMTPYFRRITKHFPRRNHSTTVRVHCRARGINNHDPRTAYIDIPPDAPHGMILICSHPTCAASGRRFRYCSICEQPVAKRNFNKRHSHGYLDHISKDELRRMEAEDEHASDEHASDEHASDEHDDHHGMELPSPKTSTDAIGKRQRLNTGGDALETMMMTMGRSSSTDARDDQDISRNNNSTALKLTEQESAWLQLFRNRPRSRSDPAVIKQWIESVLVTARRALTTPQEASAGTASAPTPPRRHHHEREHTRFPSTFDPLGPLTAEEAALWDLQSLNLEDIDFVDNDAQSSS